MCKCLHTISRLKMICAFDQLSISTTSRVNTIKARVIRLGPGCNRDEAKRFVAYGCLILFELPSR